MDIGFWFSAFSGGSSPRSVVIASTSASPQYLGLRTVIDDIEKSMALVEKMRAALPMRAFATEGVRRALRQNAKRDFPHECGVTEIRYMGDEGGIACHLDFGFSDTKEVHIVSITHLRFDRRNSLAREIDAYCKHRIKRLKKLHGGMAST